MTDDDEQPTFEEDDAERTYTTVPGFVQLLAFLSHVMWILGIIGGFVIGVTGSSDDAWADPGLAWSIAFGTAVPAVFLGVLGLGVVEAIRIGLDVYDSTVEGPKASTSSA